MTNATQPATADSPATIPVAAVSFAGTIGPLLGYFFNIDPAGVVILSAFIVAGAGFAVSIYLNRTTTSNSTPVVSSGTEVAIEGSRDTVVVQPSPPGAVSLEGGTSPQ